MLDHLQWSPAPGGDGLRTFASTVYVALLLTACGGGGESLADVDLGGGISMTPDGAIIVKSSGTGSGDKT